MAGYVLRRVPAREADDVVAQVFTVAWRRFADVPAPPGDRPWLFGVARNCVAQLRRSEHRRFGSCPASPADSVAWRAAGSPASFRVMAALPGVRLLGPMTDPLGRTAYALAGGQQDPNAVPANFNPLRIILIDPRTGSVLATEELGPMPRTLRCLSFDSHNHCAGSSYYGRSYRYQVDDYVAVVSEGWTDALRTRTACTSRAPRPAG